MLVYPSFWNLQFFKQLNSYIIIIMNSWFQGSKRRKYLHPAGVWPCLSIFSCRSSLFQNWNMTRLIHQTLWWIYQFIFQSFIPNTVSAFSCFYKWAYWIMEKVHTEHFFSGVYTFFVVHFGLISTFGQFFSTVGGGCI